MDRRTFLLATLSLPFGLFASRVTQGSAPESAQQKLEQLDADLAGRLGVCAIDTRDGAELAWRADERFPLCSTFKVILAAAVLQRSDHVDGLLDQHIRYTASDLVTHSPITAKHLDDGLTATELCAAALQYSDNGAANLLMRLLGDEKGPEAVTAFARSIGDESFRLDRWETALNSALPGDSRDTTTPRAMARSLQRLLLGDALRGPHRARLRDWMLGNTTGDARIRAGAPAGWIVGDKTGTGDYGTANDIAFLEPPTRPPIILTIYTTRHIADAAPENDVIASAARIVAAWER